MPLPNPDVGSRLAAARRRRRASAETHLVDGFVVESYAVIADVPFASTRAATPPKTSSQERPDALYGHCRTCMSSESEVPMVLCEICDRAFHIACLVPPLAEAPKGEWICARCTRTLKYKSHMRATAARSAVEAAAAAAAPAPPHRIRHKALGLRARSHAPLPPIRKRGRYRAAAAATIPLTEAIAVAHKVQKAVARARKAGTEVDDSPLVHALKVATEEAKAREAAGLNVSAPRVSRRAAKVPIIELTGATLPPRPPLHVVPHPPKKRFTRIAAMIGAGATAEKMEVCKAENASVHSTLEPTSKGQTAAGSYQMLPVKKKILRMSASLGMQFPIAKGNASSVNPESAPGEPAENTAAAPPVNFPTILPATDVPSMQNDPRPRIPTGAKRAEIFELRSKRLAQEAEAERAAAEKKTEEERRKIAGERRRARAEERKKKSQGQKRAVKVAARPPPVAANAAGPSTPRRHSPPPVQAGIPAASGSYLPAQTELEVRAQQALARLEIHAQAVARMHPPMHTAVQAAGGTSAQAPEEIAVRAQGGQSQPSEMQAQQTTGGQYASATGHYPGQGTQGSTQAAPWRPMPPVISQYAPPPTVHQPGAHHGTYSVPSGHLPQVVPAVTQAPTSVAPSAPRNAGTFSQPAPAPPIAPLPASQSALPMQHVPIPAVPNAPRVPIPEIPPARGGPTAEPLPFIPHLGPPSPRQQAAPLPHIGSRLPAPLPSAHQATPAAFADARQMQPAHGYGSQMNVPHYYPRQQNAYGAESARLPPPVVLQPLVQYAQPLPGAGALAGEEGRTAPPSASSTMSVAGGRASVQPGSG